VTSGDRADKREGSRGAKEALASQECVRRCDTRGYAALLGL
jgi:hypothetical protein